MADLSDLQKILDYRTLGTIYEDASRKAAVNNPLFQTYGAGDGENFDTDEVEFIKLSNLRDPAPLNTRNQAARVLDPTGKERRKLSMFNLFNVIQLSMGTLQFSRDPENWVLQRMGEKELAQQTEDFAKRHMLTKQLLVAKYLTGATVYISRQTGDILESGSGEYISVATGIPSQNLSQIALSSFGGSGNVIDKAWDDPSAKILDHLDLLNECVEYQGSERLRHIWLKSSNRKWIRGNDQILEFYAAGQERLDRAVGGDTFEIEDYVFHFYNGTYLDSGNAVKPFIPATQVIITPEPGDWLARGKGLQLVPRQVGIVPGQRGEWDEVYGDFAYTYQEHNPPRIDLYTGSNWLFGFKNPASIFAPTVDF